METALNHLTRCRCALGALVLALGFAACGTGGGGGGSARPIPPPEGNRDGLRGAVFVEDLFLGRAHEAEPNNSSAQPFHVAPLSAGSSTEIVGTVGETDEVYGAVDADDVIRVHCTSDADVDLELTWTPLDPVGGLDNDVMAEVRLASSGALIDSFPPAVNPSSVVVPFSASVAYDIHIHIASGHATYALTVICNRPPSPKPTPSVRAPRHRSPATVSSSLPPRNRCATEHLLVRFQAACDPHTFCATHGLSLQRRLGTGSYVVGLPSGTPHTETHVMAQCRRLEAMIEDVVFASPDWIMRLLSIPNDPLFHRQHNLRSIGAPTAWDITKGDAGVVVAVIDSGITAHVDLDANIVDGYDFVSHPGRGADGDGRDPDPTDKGDQVGSSGLSSWHGTNIAGVLAAVQDNGEFISGVAPGVSVMPLRVIGGGGGVVSDSVDAILYAAGLLETHDGMKLNRPVDVINLSLGSPEFSSDLRDACNRAAAEGVIIVAAAGNSGGAVNFPAALASVIAVGATDERNDVTSYSSRGPQVDVVAPGGVYVSDASGDGWVDVIPTTSPDATREPQAPSVTGVAGTSVSAPLVAGTAALLRSLDPAVSPEQVRAYLHRSALDIGAVGRDDASGHGVLQVHRALALLLDDAGTPPVLADALRVMSQSVAFDGFVGTRDVGLWNDGTGRLTLDSVDVETDDANPWLSATLEDTEGSGPISHRTLRIVVDGTVIPPTPATRFSGVVRILGGPTGAVLTHVRVTLLGNDPLRLGAAMRVALTNTVNAVPVRSARALPDQGYRFWFRSMPSGAYRLIGGEDRDRDGQVCEFGDVCGWYGGPTIDDAIGIDFVAGEPPQVGLDIFAEVLAP